MALGVMSFVQWLLRRGCMSFHCPAVEELGFAGVGCGGGKVLILTLFGQGLKRAGRYRHGRRPGQTPLADSDGKDCDSARYWKRGMLARKR